MTHSERKLQFLVSRKLTQRELKRHGHKSTKAEQRAINDAVKKILSLQTQALHEPRRATELPLFPQIEGRTP